RAWNLALASESPDDEAAAALEEAALASRGRGAMAASAAAFDKAAQLSSADEDRVRRLFEAARSWQLAGRSPVAARLLEQATKLTSDAIVRADIDQLAGQIEITVGSMAQASRRLVDAARAVESIDAERAAAMLP